MDTKQGSDDAVKRNLDDESDTEGQKVTHRAIPDDAPAPDDAFRNPVDSGDEDDTEGQKVTHR